MTVIEVLLTMMENENIFWFSLIYIENVPELNASKQWCTSMCLCFYCLKMYFKMVLRIERLSFRNFSNTSNIYSFFSSNWKTISKRSSLALKYEYKSYFNQLSSHSNIEIFYFITSKKHQYYSIRFSKIILCLENWIFWMMLLIRIVFYVETFVSMSQ